MIVNTATNTSPNDTGLMASKINISVRQTISVGDFMDTCCVCKCTPFQRVLANPGGEWWENDISSFIFKRVAPTDTVVMKLFKDGVETATLNDNTYGTFYNFGDLPNPDYIGYQLEWENVYDEHGYGVYHVITTTTTLGDTIVRESLEYECMQYSDDRANGTVRIETYQNGYIMSSDFDFTGMNWYQSYRIEGVLGDKKPSLEIDNYRNSARDLTQIQDSISNLYLLETKMLPSNLLNAITYDGLLANRILLTDYNICNYERYNRLEVYPDSIEDFTTFELNPHGTAKFKFTDKRQNIIKRNFY